MIVQNSSRGAEKKRVSGQIEKIVSRFISFFQNCQFKRDGCCPTRLAISLSGPFALKWKRAQEKRIVSGRHVW